VRGLILLRSRSSAHRLHGRPRLRATQGSMLPAAFRLRGKRGAGNRQYRVVETISGPALDALTSEALANNKNVKIAAANIEQAAAVLTQVRSPLCPQATYGGSAARERATEAGATPLSSLVPNPQSSYQALASELGDRPVGPYPSAL